MHIGWKRSSLALFASLLAVAISVGMLVSRAATSAKTIGACVGEYADAIQLQTPRVRDIEQGPRSQYSYLIRSSAEYECPLFGPDGKLRRRRVETSQHGTAFAYEVAGNETFLLTNEHIADWPEVTDAAHKVESVPQGCKRVTEKLRIVTDEQDDYDPGQIALAKVAVDPTLDAAVLKASQRLNALPYRVGRSAALRQGNAVQVRGFPLGVMQAVNVGKVVNPYDRDQEQGWDHVDFVIDALLSEGNSGSPVLALSCKSGLLELVGMYHAGYKGHSALNVVLGVDELRDLMVKKRRTPRGPAADALTPAIAAAERERLRTEIKTSAMPLVDFGGLFVRVEAVADATLYHFYGRDFPLDDRRAFILEDRPPEEGGETGRVWFRGDLGWREWGVPALGADERELAQKAVRALRLQALRTLDHRKALGKPSSAEERRRAADTRREIVRAEVGSRDLAGALLDLSERLGPGRDALVSTAVEPPAAPAALPHPPAVAPGK